MLNMISNEKEFKTISKEIWQIARILIKNKNTFILPTFNLRFPELKKTGKSIKFITTGFLIKFLLKRFDFKRTKKPMYNFAVIGPNSNKILKLKQTTAWGKNSVIRYLSEKKDTIGIGVNTNLLNFTWVTIHSCEEKLKVPYRYWKIFKGKNLDTKKNVSEKMFVRNLDKKKIDLKQKTLLKKLKKDGDLFLKKGKKVNYSIINLNKYYEKNLIYLQNLIK